MSENTDDILGVKKVLKPNEFQNFELKEKTIISHNVAMSVPPRKTDHPGAMLI